MKLPLTPKSFIKSPSKKPSIPPDQQPKQEEKNTDFITQTLQRPASQNDTKFRTYLKLFPQHKRKHNISLFNFFINKQPKKSQSNQKLDQSQHKEPKRYRQEQNIIKKRVKPALSSLSTEKLNLLPTGSKQKLQKIIHKANITQPETSPSKEQADRNLNKINESLVKNTKFDRKKYMYYRYRKKNSPQKNNISYNQLPQKFDIPRIIPSKNTFQQLIIKTDEGNIKIDENEHNQCMEYKYSFYGVIPPKNKSFSQAKCKLTIQPIPRQTSYKIVDRKTVIKTTRQTRDKKQPSQKQDKIFTQAIHFKSRKTSYSKSKFTKQNPQKHLIERKQQPILGWNLDQQAHMQDQYF